ncbi:hypothetical protein [Corynebacterium terpenotabidum]|uniref:Uncharacterized protein n=1 Tax=Corynebacterium terpenotabidum Y-11 TaxID=1200352 RepID=S4XI99_9CORY|nr:hypothetical protein [Corynebacterium terpenotabidum]AGP30343.1 hypothetical protein A606_03460 [Corynebacterium terpenotabidum Y-11]
MGSIDINDVLALATNPDQFIALGNLLGVFTDIIRGDLSAIFTADTSAVLSDGDGWSALGTLLGIGGS